MYILFCQIIIPALKKHFSFSGGETKEILLYTFRIILLYHSKRAHFSLIWSATDIPYIITFQLRIITYAAH